MNQLLASEKLGPRGYMYRCSRCPKEGEKRRVMDHFYRIHVPLENVPFYCTLCMFRCFTRKQLNDHVHGYKRHLNEIKELEELEGVRVDSGPFLKESSTPYMFDEEYDIIRLSVVESNARYGDRRRIEKKAVKSEENNREDIIDQLLGTKDNLSTSFLERSIDTAEKSDVTRPSTSTPIRDENHATVTVSQSDTFYATPVAQILPNGDVQPYEASSQDIVGIQFRNKMTDSEMQTETVEDKPCDQVGLGRVLEELNACCSRMCDVILGNSSSTVDALDRVASALREQASAFRELTDVIRASQQGYRDRSHEYSPRRHNHRNYHPYSRK